MNKKEKRILKLLNKETNPNKGLIINMLRKKTNYSEEELEELLEDLIKKGLVDSNFIDIYNVNIDKEYYSTLTGKQFFKNQKNKFLEKIFINIFCPIIVSFITTLITIFFTN